ncbi:MAG: cation transporter [Spongiibacteraceae bacterium]|jgi:Co/Zn/Cd efflux system component|nr:cation transporter [Spongiibacteraceae bacterium]
MQEVNDKPLFRTTFLVRNMDCAAEQQLVRGALEGSDQVLSLNFDLNRRQVTVIHSPPSATINRAMRSLQLGAEQVSSEPYKGSSAELAKNQLALDQEEAATLRWLLAINFVMFVVEIVAGIWAQSAGLIADSLDMLADASVYALGLFAVGRSASLKLTAARTMGWLQLVLGIGVLVEVLRRFVYGSEPESLFMMGIGALALAANITCLLLLAKKKDSGVHMTATWICSSNDVIANAGVILAGFLVMLTQSPYPDLVIGLLITGVVLNGSRRILALKA